LRNYKASKIEGRVFDLSVITGCIFSVLGLALYWNSLDNPFCYLDDPEYVVINPNIREIGNIPKFFIDPRLSTRTPRYTGHYRPLVTASYAIDYAIGRLNPVVYHLTNLSFHIGSSILVFFIMQTMIGGKGERSPAREIASLAAGLVFLVHPFNSEAVNYITARSSVMNGFFFLLAFYCWMRFRSAGVYPPQEAGHEGRRYFYLGSLFAFAFSMLSKEVAITLPVLIWLYDLLFLHETSKSPQDSEAYKDRWGRWRWRVFSFRNYLYYLPFILMVVIPYLLIRVSHFGRIFPSFRRDLMTQIFTGLPILVRHLSMFILPKGQSVFHDVEIYREVNSTVFLSGFLLLLYTTIAIFLARSRYVQWRIVSFFMFWFFIVMIPMVIVPLNAIFRESRGYLAVMSFAVFVGAILFELGRRGLNRISIGVIVVLFMVYSAVTFQRNVVWGDEVLLWKDAVEKSPKAGITHAGLTAAYLKKGDVLHALNAARKGLSVAPDNYYLLVNLGDGLQLYGKTDEALMVYKRALSIDPSRPTLWNAIASSLRRKGDFDAAEFYLREGLKIGKDYSPLYYNLGMVLIEKGDTSGAIEALKEAISLYPSYVEARFGLAKLLERLGRFDEARREYLNIARIDVNHLGPESLIYDQDKQRIEDLLNEARRRLM